MRGLMLRVILSFGLLLSTGVGAETYPTKPIRMVIPFAAGGVVDILGRILAERISANWGQPIVVEPRPGGNTMIGTELVLSAPPDGYTWLMVAQNHAVNAAVFPDLRWDPVRDFVGAGLFARTVPYLIVPASLPVQNLDEFIRLAKSQPGKLNYGHAGVGSPPHLGFELFKHVVGITITPIPYKGNPPIVADLMSGRLNAALLSSVTTGPAAKGGKVKPLAVMDSRRSRAFPEVPSIAEAGYPDAQTASWFGVVLSAKTPGPIVKRIADEIEKAAKSPDMSERLEKVGAELSHLGPKDFNALIARDVVTWKRVIKEAGIKLE